jgi:hypothetical protein
MRRALLPLLSALLVGCAGERTEVVVVVSSGELVVPDDLDGIRLTVTDRSIPEPDATRFDQTVPLCRPDQRSDCYPLPLVLTLVPGSHRGGDPVSVDVQALRGAEQVLRNEATFTFRSGTSMRLDFILYGTCIGSDCAAASGGSCDARGSCGRLEPAPLAGDLRLDLGSPRGDASASADLAPPPADLAPTDDGGAIPVGDAASPPDLTPPPKHRGDPCTAGVDACEAGSSCIDGYCCNSTCTGNCEACDVSGALGTCTPVSGPPHRARACNGSGTCGGACNGSSAACVYPASQVICGAACDGHCDGAGSCSAATGGTCPNGFACGSSACLTSCSKAQDCQANFTCQAPSCVRVPESDCLDGLDNNGDGLADCADPTCSGQVQCVTDVPVGDAVGLITTGSCPTDYGTAVPYHQTIITPPCVGCGCTATMTCQTTLKFGTTVASPCTGLTTFGTLSTTSQNNSLNVINCFMGTTIPSNAYWASYSHPAKLAATTCAATGSATSAAAYFDSASTTNFCAARTSPTCTANHICVRKPTLPVCARVPTANAGCPGGYDTGTSATWYRSIVDSHSCSGCGGCTITNQGDCDGTMGAVWLANQPDLSDESIYDYVSTVQVSDNYCVRMGANRTNTYGCPWDVLGNENSACTSSASVMNPPSGGQGSTFCCP